MFIRYFNIIKHNSLCDSILSSKHSLSISGQCESLLVLSVSPLLSDSP